eukprot:jgi/Tetstr1/424748/TSEL_015265.t1
MQRDHRLHSQQEVDVVVDGKVRIPQRVKAQMKEHIDDAPMRLVEKLNKEDRKIADARAWRVAFQAWKSSLTRAEKTPRAYESIADLRDCVRRNEMLPLLTATRRWGEMSAHAAVRASRPEMRAP